MAAAQRSLGQVVEAADSLGQAAKLNPAHVHEWAEALVQLGQSHTAIKALKESLQAANENGAPVCSAAALKLRQTLSKALLQAGLPGAEVPVALCAGQDPGAYMSQLSTLLPPILQIKKSAAKIRAQLIAGLSCLQQRLPGLPQSSFVDTLYHSTYHGLPEASLRSEVGRVHEIGQPHLSRVQVEACPARQTERGAPQMRVGFVLSGLTTHSVTKMSARLLTTLPRTVFQVSVYVLSDEQDSLASWLVSELGNVQVLSPPAEGMSLTEVAAAHQETIAAEAFDAIVYPELGMGQLLYLIALGRLAPVQITSHGNSVTSGLASIDYFVSFDALEPRSAKLHYSEQVVRLQGFHSQFLHTPYPLLSEETAEGILQGARSAAVVLTAAHAHSPTHQRPVLIAVPQMLYKLHPDFDSVMIDVLNGDRRAELILLTGKDPAWSHLVSKRLLRATAAAGLPAGLLDRVHFVPQRRHKDFVRLLGSVHVILDTWPFGGCTSSLEALLAGTPVVSWPGPELRGRFTMAMLNAFGLSHLVARNSSDLVQLALRVARSMADADPGERASARHIVAERALFGVRSETPVHEWSRFLLRAHRLLGDKARSAKVRAVADHPSPLGLQLQYGDGSDCSVTVLSPPACSHHHLCLAVMGVLPTCAPCQHTVWLKTPHPVQGVAVLVRDSDGKVMGRSAFSCFHSGTRAAERV